MPMRTVFLPLLFFILLCFSASGQAGLDSLRGIWNDVSQSDSVRLRAIHRIAWHGHLRSNPDSALHYSQLQYAFAEQRGRKREMALALNTQGAVFEVKGDYAEAIARHEASLAIRSELGNVAGITASLTNIGNIHAFTGDHAKALDYYIRTVKVYEQDGDAPGKGMANVLNNIAGTYHLQEDLQNALLYYRRSLVIREQLDLKDDIAQSLANIGIALHGLGELDSALVNFNRSLEIGTSTGNRWVQAAALSSIGSVMNTKGEYLKAAGLFERAVALGEEAGDMVSTAGYLTNASAAHMKLGNTAKALLLSTRAYVIAKETGDAVLLRDAAQNHSEILKANGRFKEALEAYELHVLMRDSVMREENQREAIKLEFMQEAELRESEIALLNSENQRKEAERIAERNKRFLTMGVGGMILLSVLGGGTLVMRNRRQRHQIALNKAELQRNMVELEKNHIENDYLRSRLNTHFMKNALQSINGLIGSGQHAKAQEYIERFHRLMQWTLENASSDQVSLTEELEMLQHYLTLEAPCAEDGLRWEVHVADGIDTSDVELPPLILQPFVENALRHGITGTGREGHIHIGVRRQGDEVVCTVEDNGRGMAEGAESKLQSTGLRLVRERLGMFSNMTGMAAAMRMENTGSGTRAEVRLAA